MNGGLCLCDICCSEDASETSEDSPPQSPAQNAKQKEEELDEEYNQWCDSLTEIKEYEEGLEQTLKQGHEFFENNFRRVVKRKYRRISNDKCESMKTKWEEMEERGGEGLECYIEWNLTGEFGNDGGSDREIDDDNNDVVGLESDEEEDKYQEVGDGDWECSTEELGAAIWEYEELVGSLHGDDRRMAQCCV